MSSFTRRTALLGTGAALGALGARWIGGRNPSLDGQSLVGPTPDGMLNDASLLNPTPVAKHLTLAEDPGEALVAAIRAELAEARAEGRPLNVGAARHSMGGQAIPRDGTAITFDNGFLEADTDAGLFRVHGGARWSQVISALDPIGFGPKVMQSNNDFGVAATFSVNAHGWPVSHGPMGATVRQVTMVLPSGDLVTASRNENPDLFAHAMGGYGLTGVITEMVVEMAPNMNLEPSFQEVPGADFGPAFVDALSDPAVNMAYGRMNVDRETFFDEALIITYRPAEDQSEVLAASGSGLMSHVARHIFRAQLGNERFKRWRWAMEADLGPRIGAVATRNSLINEPVVTLDDRDPTRTDILHEYFVAPDRFAEFVTACQEIIPESYQELLNITLRFVDADTTSLLSYAPVPRIAAVMLFSQEMTERAEADMARMTEALIDRTHAIGGSYYLPYRQHARLDQFATGYPRAAEFVAEKRAIDPDLVLRNNLWDSYLGRL